MSTSAKRPDPPNLPTVFTDRSIGDKRAPQLLREEGLKVVTKKQCYGNPLAENLADEVWLEMVGRKGWVAFGADKFANEGEGVLTDPAKRAVLTAYKVRYFVLNSGEITFEDKAGWFLNNIDDIVNACKSPGPFCYVVMEDSISLVPLSNVRDVSGGGTSRLFP